MMQSPSSSQTDEQVKPPAQSTLKPKRSLALPAWMAIMVFVLVALAVETRRSPYASYNLFLSGDSQLLGAKVVVDGHFAGAMSRPVASGLGGATFYGRVCNGAHDIEVSKPGYQPFRKRIFVHKEDYLSVDLKPQSL